jgi:hypothetical protein
MIKLRMRWAEHVTCKGLRNAYIIFIGKPERKRHLRILGMNQIITLRCILRKKGVMV